MRSVRTALLATLVLTTIAAVTAPAVMAGDPVKKDSAPAEDREAKKSDSGETLSFSNDDLEALFGPAAPRPEPAAGTTLEPDNGKGTPKTDEKPGEKADEKTDGKADENADAKPDQANKTNQKIIRESVNARANATPPRATVTHLPIFASRASLAVLPRVFCTTSRTTAEDARISSESAVDIIAARTTTRKTPVKNEGNKLAAISGKMVSGSPRPGYNTRPAMPANTAPTSKPITHNTAHRPPSTICF